MSYFADRSNNLFSVYSFSFEYGCTLDIDPLKDNYVFLEHFPDTGT